MNSEENSTGMSDENVDPGWDGLAPIPNPSSWDYAYGLDMAVAVALTPDRALVFWELATLKQAGIEPGTVIRLTRVRIQNREYLKEESWGIEWLGRFQDNGVKPGCEYFYILSKSENDNDIPTLLTNPIRMPFTRAPLDIPGDLPSSIEYLKIGLRDIRAKEKGDLR